MNKFWCSYIGKGWFLVTLDCTKKSGLDFCHLSGHSPRSDVSEIRQNFTIDPRRFSRIPNSTQDKKEHWPLMQMQSHHIGRKLGGILESPKVPLKEDSSNNSRWIWWKKYSPVQTLLTASMGKTELWWCSPTVHRCVTRGSSCLWRLFGLWLRSVWIFRWSVEMT